MHHDILIGTSGWSYDEWIGPFYPRGLRKKDFLAFYSQVYYTNEINTTFYNIPSKNIVEKWAKKTPSDFIFSVKVPKVITHEAKLEVNKCRDVLDYFLATMQPLIDSKKILAFLR